MTSLHCSAAAARPPVERAFRWPVRRANITMSLLLGLFLVGVQGWAVTLQELRDLPQLTPEIFMGYFRDFGFKLSEKLQAPEDFLAGRSGDCDDFACLAAEVLGEKKYTTRLIAIFMEGQTHVVCYVKESRSYLDYNCRRLPAPLQPTDGELEDIADKVALYFHSTWHCVAEYNSQAGIRRFGRIAFR